MKNFRFICLNCDFIGTIQPKATSHIMENNDHMIKRFQLVESSEDKSLAREMKCEIKELYWTVYFSNKKIKVKGKNLKDALRDYGKKYPNTDYTCGLLVLVNHNKIDYYLSGKEFLKLLGMKMEIEE